jgi:F0F1-type ATP synthase assembly protein I
MTKFIIIKYIITAAVVVLVSEFAKTSDKLGGLVAALPLVTVLTLIWLFVENQPTSKIANHAYYTFWYVIPTLPMFLLFPYLLPKWGFWPTLVGCVAFTLAVFYVYAMTLKNFGINLL